MRSCGAAVNNNNNINSFILGYAQVVARKARLLVEFRVGIPVEYRWIFSLVFRTEILFMLRGTQDDEMDLLWGRSGL